MSPANLDGVRMFVSATANDGVVDVETVVQFRQRGARVLGWYRGGRIRRGCLAGAFSGGVLRFRYVQAETSGEVHAGRSECDLVRTPEGRMRLLERFVWTTRPGRGTNVFDEVADPTA
ncbi:MAG TPA: hypothetical protein VIB08_03315 [Thermoanaerobaculia bacterium]|jgi:hypothetical protein